MITAKEILEHREFYGLEKNIQDMSIKEYDSALKKDAILTLDSHGFIADSFTGMPLAADSEQLTVLIAHLESLRKYMCEKNYGSGRN